MIRRAVICATILAAGWVLGAYLAILAIIIVDRRRHRS